MKLYILDGGFINHPDKSSFTQGIGEKVPFTFKVPMYLIEHSKGLVVIDLGIVRDKFPEFMKGDTIDEPEKRIDRQIEALGYSLADVKYVILTHMHIDHTGGMEYLPDATYIVRREEMKEAWFPRDRGPVGEGYCYENFKNTRFYKYIELEPDEEYDVFGDGTIVCFDTRGHSIGHQSVAVNLPESGKIVIASDAASVSANLDLMIPPGCCNLAHALEALYKLNAMRREGSLVITGHDPEQWKMLRIAPEYYE